jgi:hypothetical protein
LTKYLTAVLIAIGLAFSTIGSAEAHVKPAHACRFQSREQGVWTTDEVKWTARCLADWMNVDVSHAMYVGFRESRWHRYAVSWTGCCYGVYQHQLDLWPGRVRSHSRKLKKFAVHDRDWDSPRAQAVVTFAMVKQGGWSPWGG